MRRKIKISITEIIISNSKKHIYTTKHINNANNNTLIEKKYKSNTTKTNKKNDWEK